jgi:4-hydroxyacetophenone monooxygenase
MTMTSLATAHPEPDPDGSADRLAGADPRLLALSLATVTGSERWVSAAMAALCDALEQGRSLDAGQEQLLSGLREAAGRLAEAAARPGGRRPAQPSRALLQRLVRFAVGQDLPGEYVAKLAQDFGYAPARDSWTAPADTDFRVAVIGAGICRLTVSMRLREYGIPYVVLEKNADLGGTWLENIYPGCGVDTPNHLYSFTEALNPDWTTRCARRQEILDYLHATAETMRLTDAIRFGVEVTACRWDEASCRWELRLRCGDGTSTTVWANAVVSANGSLNRPKIPEIPGLDRFRGQAFHSARWPAGLDLGGLRVGLVGNGSSGVQLGRALAEQAAHLTAFQRTPHWIVPNKMAQETIPEQERWRLREFPYYALWHRFIMFWVGGDLNYPNLIVDRSWPGPGINAQNAKTRERLVEYITEETGGRADLVEALVPDYPPYVKRMVWDNNWYRTLARPNVELCTAGISRVDETGVITADGRHHDLDILVFATGFHGTRFLYPMEVRGRSGRTPAEIFGRDDEIRAYVGVAIPGFPNFFRLFGPNSSVGHGGSSMFLSEMQAHYVQDCLRYLIDKRVPAIEVEAEVCAAYNQRVDAGLADMVWSSSSVGSRYLTASGRMATNHPWTLQDYWVLTRRMNPADYEHLAPVKSP